MLCAAAMLASCSAPVSKELPRVHSDAMEAAVKAYVEAAAEKNLPINTIMVLQHGNVLAEAYVNGWTPDSTHHMWSTSKSYTSMAVGFAINEGKLSLDDHLVDFFPEESSEALAELTDSSLIANMKACTIKDLLVMSSGQDVEPVFGEVEKLLQERAVEVPELTGNNLSGMDILFRQLDINLQKQFFKVPFVHKPGTHNLYNSPATYMLSVIVQKVTGQKVVDYLEPRLWEPLGMEKPFWQELEGSNTGGWGLFLTPEQMAKTGQMLLQNGEYAGRQVLPADYLKEATTPYFKWGWPEWDPQKRGRGPHNGYGYQFWTFTEGFNTAGAQGQFILVIPMLDAVITCTAEILDGDFQETELIWKHIIPALEAETLQEVEIDGAVGKLRGDLRIPQEAVKGQKVPMVIICHGLTASRNEPLLNGVAMAAQRMGMASVKFDFNGHGHSDGRFVNHTVLNETEDLEKIYEYVKSLPYVDHDRIAVMGHSQGGAVVTHFAGLHPELGALILCAAAPLELSMDAWKIRAQFPGTYPDNLPDSLLFGNDHYIGKQYIMASCETDFVSDLQSFKHPSCIVHGDSDDLIAVTQSCMMNAILPNSELHILEGLEHSFQPDEQRAIDVIADFLNRKL